MLGEIKNKTREKRKITENSLGTVIKLLDPTEEGEDLLPLSFTLQPQRKEK